MLRREIGFEPHPPVGEQLHDGPEHLVDRVRARLVEVEGLVVDSGVVGRHLMGVADVRLPHLDEVAPVGQQRQRGVDELVRKGVQHDVHTAAAQRVEELLGEVQIARRCQVRLVHSQAAQYGPLGRARGGVDLGADVLGQLNGGHPDAACRGVDEDPLALLEIRHVEEPVVGGEEGARHGRRLGVAPPVGDGHEHAVVRHGRTAEGAGEDAGHPVTGRQTRHVVRHLQHDSGALAAEPCVDGRSVHQPQRDGDVTGS